MLRYVNSGVRDFAVRPVPIQYRVNWEFYAVLSGSCACLFDPNLPLDWHKSSFWILPPLTAHGWTGIPRHPCQIACFHFGSVLEPLRSLTLQRGFIRIDFDERGIRQLRNLSRELAWECAHQNGLSGLRFQRAMIDLCLLVLRDAKLDTPYLHDHANSKKVEEAMNWYRDNLEQAPSMEKVAKAVHLSPSQFNRIFQSLLNQSPKRTFHGIQMERAIQFLSEKDWKVSDIANRCGFQSASQFSRVFTQDYQCSPAQWRKELFKHGYAKNFKMALEKDKKEA